MTLTGSGSPPKHTHAQAIDLASRTIENHFGGTSAPICGSADEWNSYSRYEELIGAGEHSAMNINIDHVRKARGFFRVVEGPFGPRMSFTTRLHTVDAEVRGQIALAALFADPSLENSRLRHLNRALSYASGRLIEPFGHLRLLDFLMQYFATTSDPEGQGWRFMVGLLIKDFHSDLSSLMDSIAPIAIGSEGSVKSDQMIKLPGFADIQAGTQRSYRNAFSPALLSTIDSTESWWPEVKKVRNILLHQEHTRLVFGTPSDGVLFNLVPDQANLHLTIPDFAFAGNPHVIVFKKYAAYVLAEILVLLDRLGKHVEPTLGLDTYGSPQEFQECGVAGFVDNLEELLNEGSST